MTIFRISFVRISEIEMKTKKGKDMTCEEVLEWLAAHANPEFREGMVRFGIDARLAVGVRVVDLRRLAREIGRDHALALELYRRPVHEGRILASMIADPALFRPEEMDAWVAEFRSWDLCDQCCINLFRYTSYAYGKVREYEIHPEDFGLTMASHRALKVDTPEQSRALLQAVLDNQPGPARDIVMLNAGVALYAANVATTMAEGIDRAREALASGRAAERLTQFVARAQQLAA